ncbi:MEI2-like 2 [Striga asiatica]|uniref:MEI2-like 2 n=1 Tax=Striga asiatica TaxID=4170 RepID=A0A5A7PGP7_STRAF|nr:MEI2-like 2 [Striga asiatica]
MKRPLIFILSLREAQSLLLTFESMIERNTTNTLNGDGFRGFANISSQQTSKRGGFSPNPNTRGRFNQGRGGYRGGRFERNNNYRGRGGRSSFVRCQICQKDGHTADRNYSRFDQSYTYSQNNNFRTQPVYFTLIQNVYSLTHK